MFTYLSNYFHRLFSVYLREFLIILMKRINNLELLNLRHYSDSCLQVLSKITNITPGLWVFHPIFESQACCILFKQKYCHFERDVNDRQNVVKLMSTPQQNRRMSLLFRKNKYCLSLFKSHWYLYIYKSAMYIRVTYWTYVIIL